MRTRLARFEKTETYFVALMLSFLCWPSLVYAANASSSQGPELLESRRIWDKAPHNAFTDLLRHQDRWWCTFREGTKHVSPDGALRVITSSDGVKWESAALIRSSDADLRDPKISVTPAGEFMLNAAGALHKPNPFTHQSYVWFSKDGRAWSEPVAVGEPSYWLWRVAWHKGVCYGGGYDCAKERDVRLYRSRDGRQFEKWVEDFCSQGGPNESSLVFLPDDTALCLMRRDSSPGLLGSAKPPYREWTWKDLKTRIGGPHMLLLPDGRLVAAVRLYDKKVRTSVCWVDDKRGTIEEALALPSGGDSSYAGLVWHEGLLWVSYYSSHEGKTAIYLAKVKLPARRSAG